jgi:hypothetical protein
MPDEYQSAEGGIRRRKTTTTTWIAYGLRVAQLLGLAGLVHGVILLVKPESSHYKPPEFLVYAICFLLLTASTLALAWFKRRHPQAALKAIQSADKRWNTPLDERRAKIWILCILAGMGAIVLWMLVMMGR